MAPEQFDDVPSTPAVDLYALGAILHEMLTGTTMFGQRDTVGTIRAIRELPPPPLPGEVPEEIRRIVRSLLEKDPTVRARRAGIVAGELEAVSVGAPA
jgi:serine/threonine-protein kinase